MSVVYIPVYRTAASYTVSVGRRWSVLEQMLLLELAPNRRTVVELAAASHLPERLVIEALIRLLRVNWVEVRATNDAVLFAATLVGKRVAAEKDLPVHLEREERWISLCFDRVTGSWSRADDLSLVYERDLPEDAQKMEPRFSTYDSNDGAVRSLLYLRQEEALEQDEPRLRTPSRAYARVEVSLDRQDGLPSYAPLRLREAVISFAESLDSSLSVSATANVAESAELFCEDLSKDSLIVGGSAHFESVRDALETASTAVVIHSCFIQAAAVEKLVPALDRAAKRGVRVELLWGLKSDVEGGETPAPVSEARTVLGRLSASSRAKVQLSGVSSMSHAKVIISDGPGGNWRSIVGSCNFLSSNYDAVDLSVLSRNPRLAERLLATLVVPQLPSVGGWSSVARRINKLWQTARLAAVGDSNQGAHCIELVMDADHYSMVRLARDVSTSDILVACDLFGKAAETAALVPLQRASELGRKVSLFFQRPSRAL